MRFSDDPSLGMADAVVKIPSSKLVVGLAAGWCGAGDPIKAVCIDPVDVCAANEAFPIRGAAFWNIEEDGSTPSGADEPLCLASGLRECFHQ